MHEPPKLVSALRELLSVLSVGSEEEPPSVEVWSPSRGEFVWGILPFNVQELLTEIAEELPDGEDL